MTSRDPLVSVVIPAYNAVRWIREAVESVLFQEWRDFELIVVDDGSTDGTPKELGAFRDRLTLLEQGHGGVSRARNRGTRAANGRLVSYLDADDVWRRDKLSRQLAALEAAPRARFCAAAFVVADEDLNPISVRRIRPPDPRLVDLLFGNVVGTPSTVICDRQLVLSTGGFRENLSQCADWDLWIRLRPHTRFVCLDEPIATYRTHPASMSRRPSLLERDTIDVLERAFSDGQLPARLRLQRRRSLAWNYRVLSGTYYHAKCRWDAVRCFLRAVQYHWRTPFGSFAPVIGRE